MSEQVRCDLLGTVANDGIFNLSDRTYPYLIVRIFTAIYQRERIAFCIGPPVVEIVNRSCFVQHPAPFAADGTVSPACRALLLAGVQDAVRRLPFRMCVVWAAQACTYVETDSMFDSDQPASGGSQPIELQFKPQHFEPDESCDQ